MTLQQAPSILTSHWADRQSAQGQAMRLTLIGHMTVWIELDGRVLLTDPWFGPRGWLERRLAPRTTPPVALPASGRPDVLLVSHNHLDHVDATTLDLARRLGCTVVGSQKAASRARKAGVEI